MTIIHATSRFHIETAEELERLRARLVETKRSATPVGFDWETTGPSNSAGTGPDPLRHVPVGFSWGFADGECVYVPTEWEWSPVGERYRLKEYPTNKLLRYLGVAGAPVWAHNAKYELHIATNVGQPVRCDLRCSQIAAWLAGWKLDGKGGLKLKPLARAYLGYRGPSFDDVAQGRDASDIPVADIAPYAAHDALLTLQLGTKAMLEFDRLDLWNQWRLDMATLPVTAHMERTGVELDRPMLLAAAEQCEAEMEVVRDTFRTLTRTTVSLPTKVREQRQCATHNDARMNHQCLQTGCMGGLLWRKNGKPWMHTVVRDVPTEAGADVGSDAQVRRWLFEELKWWPQPTDKWSRTEGGEASTKAEHIMPHAALPGPAGEAARLRLRFQALRKYASTYTRGLVEAADASVDGRLHTSYNQTGTDTQRFSSSGPNISNIPRSKRAELPWMNDLPDIRAAFRTRPGWSVVIFDYSQIEPRLLAHLSRDPLLLAIFNASGKPDVYQPVADAAGCSRQDAKTTVLSTMYRVQKRRLALRQALAANDWTGRINQDTAQASIDAFFDTYPGVADYHERAIQAAKLKGYAATITGFKRPLRKWGRDDAWGTGNRAINTPIQGSAGGILKMALTELYGKWLNSGKLGITVNLVGTTYDEICVECVDAVVSEVEADMKAAMVAVGNALKLRVPLAVEGGHGASWSDAK